MNTHNLRFSTLFKLSLIAATLSVAACNDDDTLRNPGGGHNHAESSGRLAFANAEGDPQLVVLDLDSRASTVIDLSNRPTAVYASPEHRYAIVTQGDAGQISFVDGGVYAHDDHVDVETPSLLGLTLLGAKPSHYEVHEEQAAYFFDGDENAPARFDLLSDESIESGGVIASATLPAAVHGVAEPRDGYVLAADYFAEEAAAGTPRNAVKKYELHGDHFHDEGRFATPCENLHGSKSNEDYTAFGCQDGVLLIEQDGDAFTDSKIGTDKRISQIAGHHAVAVFAAFAGPADGDAMYVIDPAQKTATPFDWKQGAQVNRRQQAFDAHGEHLLILDSAGNLHVLEAGADSFESRGTIPVFSGDQTAARIATSAASDQAYVTDPAGRTIAVIDLETLEVVDHIDLDFAPVGVAWLGVAGDGHTH